MKNLTTNLMITMAALAALAGTAAAQTYKAQLPTAFRAGSAMMEPGSYEFTVLNGSQIQVRNAQTRNTVLLLTIPGHDAPMAWQKIGTPMLSLTCAGRTCSLTRLWNARGISTYEFPAVKLPAGERVAMVTLPMTRTD